MEDHKGEILTVKGVKDYTQIITILSDPHLFEPERRPMMVLPKATEPPAAEDDYVIFVEDDQPILE